MSTYLEKYLESIANLPHEVKRNFALMQDLDQQTQGTMDKLEQSSRAYLKRKAKDASVADDRALQKIRDDFKRAMEMGDEKIELAAQTYELVDKHIRRLDADLKKFEAELEQQGDQSCAARETKGKGKGTKASKHKENGKGQKKSVRTSELPPDAAPRLFNVDIDMPIDPNEPTYCICNRVSFGEMVGCDNPDCRVEWFHFECVGLTSPPKGKWYCNECSVVRKKQGIIKK